MSQEGDFHYPIHELLSKRWSPRAFADRMVEKDKLQRLMEAARWAPSCFNEQPWCFFVATREDSALFDQMSACLVEGNRLWAQKAPVLMLSVAQKNFKKNDKPNRHAFHDVGLAVGHMLVQATHEGLFIHQMAGFDTDMARHALEIPKSHDPVAMIAVGYLGDPAHLPDNLREREVQRRNRKPLGEFIFSEKWGQKPAWVE